MVLGLFNQILYQASINPSVMELIWNKLSNPLKGLLTNNQSEPIYNDDSTEQYALVTTSHEVLDFDHQKSTALCIGIDRQLHRQYVKKSLGKIVARDAREIGEALVTNLGFTRDQVKVRISSAQLDANDCTKPGLGTLFVKSANAVGENGIFIFYFAGHGYLVNGRCVLAPADFAGREDLNSGISGDDLVEWLHVAECKANHVLIILDCCFAGDLGTTLTSPDNMLKIKPGLFVMCGCAAREKCTSVDALGHSIFTYFFLDYLKRHHCRGQFAVKQAMEYITELCFNFSSLLVLYSHEKGELQYSTMNPTLDTLDIHVDNVGADEPDFGGRFELVVQLFEHGQPKSTPHPAVEKWLRLPTTQNALHTLYSRVTLSEALQEGILSSLLYSAASIQYAFDKRCLEERNLFLMTVVSVLGAIGFACPEVNPTIFHLITGLEHYMAPAKRINTKSLDNLLSKMVEVANGTVTDNIVSSGSYEAESDSDEIDYHAVQPHLSHKVFIVINCVCKIV